MKKIYIFIFFTFICIFLFNCNVKAEVYTSTFNQDNLFIARDSYSGYFTTNINTHQKQGYLLFTATYGVSSGNVNEMRPLNEIYVQTSDNEKFVCQYGSISQYIDTAQMNNSISVVCPLDTQVSISRIYFGFNRDQNYDQGVLIDASDHISFITEDSEYTDVINAINSLGVDLSTINTSINNWGQDIWNKTQSNTQSLIDRQERIITILSGMQTAQVNAINQNTQAVQDQTDTIKNDNVSGAESSADDLVNNSAFDDNSGLSGIVSMPLTFVNSLTSSCSPITLTIPYLEEDVTIPCIQPLITSKMPLLANLIKIVINGFIVYRILLDIFQIVRNAKNPEDDRIEVLDL